MALRVLLADESSTIKRALQMVLSDYGVEVKSVPTGIDVMAVVQTFNPDIVIADVLLNSKNGYDVCTELKNKSETKNIPVVLMWSNFMQLDQSLYEKSKADASIEKPFDSETIRNLVEKLVPKLQSFPLKGLLQTPQLPDFVESETYYRQKNERSSASGQDTNSDLSEALNLLNTHASYHTSPSSAGVIVDEQTDTKSTKVDRSLIEASDNSQTAQGEADEWSPSRTRQIIIETENFGDFEEVTVIDSSINKAPELQQKLNEQVQSYLKDSPVASQRAKTALNSEQRGPLSSFEEQVMREEIRHITEKICWQIIPEITEKLVREELKKLLEGIDKSL